MTPALPRMPSPIAVGYDHEALRNQAEGLARALHLPVDNQALPRLNVTTDRLVLLVAGFLPLSVNFDSPQIRRRQQAGKSQGLIRACCPAPGLHIVDATAGFGRDAAILAGLGADVVMVERHPFMCALLTDALRRMHESMGASAVRLSLVSADAASYLTSLDPMQRPDVIYIDPMHPARQKSALVKKEMQVLQQMIGPDLDSEALVSIAIPLARQRVVVKWPQRLAPVGQPNYSFDGKTVRFDVYLRGAVE